MKFENLKLIVRSALVGATVLGASLLALAGPTSYANRLNTIRAGIVITESNQVSGVPANDYPFIWFNLEQEGLIKPAGWTFTNPHAPGIVTPDIYNRWTVISGALGVSGPAPIGTLITKNMAPYWEVPLTTVSDSSISDYDVLYLSASNALSLNPAERNRLTRFVDQGGVLWIDVDANTIADAANGAPLSFVVNKAGTPTPNILNNDADLNTDKFTLSTIPTTGQSYLGPVNLASAGYGALTTILSPVGPEFNRYEVDAVNSANQPTVLSAHLGTGVIVVTAGSVGSYLNQYYIAGSNQKNVGFSAGQFVTTPAADAAAEFAINAIFLRGNNSQVAQGSRKANGSPIDIGAPLIERFKDESKGGTLPGQTPVVFKGLVFVSLGNRLFAYSARPGSDLDHNGNPDDGIQDLTYGEGRDLVWESSPLNGPLSAPVAYSVPNGTDEVAVVDGQGQLDVFRAFPVDSNGFFITADNPPLGTFTAPNGSPMPPANGLPPFAPTEFNGLLYITDNVDNGFGSATGRVWVFDPVSGTSVNNWAVGGLPNQVLAPASASTTVGYIPVAGSTGEADLVAYVPTAPNTSGFGGSACGITSLWIATKGESHSLSVSGSQIQVVTRASSQGAPIFLPGANSPYGIKVTLVRADGSALTVAQMSNLLDGTVTNNNGVLGFGLKGGVTLGTLQGDGVTAVSVDYWIDWDNTQTDVRNVVRGAISLPDDTDRAKQILGQIALGPDGTLYCTEGDPFGTGPSGSIANGSFFALKETERGLFTVDTRFDLYPAFTYQAAGAATSTQMPTTLEDLDPTQNFAPGIIGGNFVRLMFTSGPSVQGNNVFVTARGYKVSSFGGFNVPCTILMCFQAHPSLPVIETPQLENGFEILQPDLSRSSSGNKTNPDVFTQAVSTQLKYVGGLDGGRITFDSLAATNRGALDQTLNESLPVIIRQPGRSDIVIDPSTNGTWNPLQWYTVFHGIDDASESGAPVNFTTGAPVVTGNSVFVAGNSLTPAIFSGGNPLVFKPTGLLVAMAADISDTDPYLTSDPSLRPYQKQLTLIANPSGTTITSNPDMLWPQMAGVNSFTVYLQRLLQTALGGSDVANARTCFGISAGGGVLMANADTGIYAFEKSDFVVADEGRIISFDPSGNPIWSTDDSLNFGQGQNPTDVNPPGVVRPLSEPSRAYPVGTSNYVVVDPSTNRIVIVDRAGHEQRSITGFHVDPNFIPDGFRSGETTTFNHPSDVLTYSDFHFGSPFSNPQPLEFWRHYVIADRGNKRIVEIVDRYNVDTVTHQPTTLIDAGVLFYHSPSNFSGKNFDYNSISRVAVTVPGKSRSTVYAYAAGIGGTMPTSVDLGLTSPKQAALNQVNDLRESHSGNGGIVLFDGANSQVINEVLVPQIPAGVIYDPTTNTFNAQPIPAQMHAIGNLSSVSVANVTLDPTNPQSPYELRVMFTDDTGVYEAAYDQTQSAWVVRWMLPNIVYTQLRRTSGGALLPNNPLALKATYARRLDDGSVIVVNGYVGTTLGGQDFKGEVLELEGNTAAAVTDDGFNFGKPYLGFLPTSIRFVLPPIEGTRGLVAPVFADRR